jgi:hypothetical protein
VSHLNSLGPNRVLLLNERRKPLSEFKKFYTSSFLIYQPIQRINVKDASYDRRVHTYIGGVEHIIRGGDSEKMINYLIDREINS